MSAGLFIVTQCLDAWACSCSGNDAYCHCYCSYHALISLKYENHTSEITMAKRLVGEKGILVREVER